MTSCFLMFPFWLSVSWSRPRSRSRARARRIRARSSQAWLNRVQNGFTIWSETLETVRIRFRMLVHNFFYLLSIKRSWAESVLPSCFVATPNVKARRRWGKEVDANVQFHSLKIISSNRSFQPIPLYYVGPSMHERIVWSMAVFGRSDNHFNQPLSDVDVLYLTDTWKELPQMAQEQYDSIGDTYRCLLTFCFVAVRLVGCPRWWRWWGGRPECDRSTKYDNDTKGTR